MHRLISGYEHRACMGKIVIFEDVFQIMGGLHRQQWLALLPHSQKVAGLIPTSDPGPFSL